MYMNRWLMVTLFSKDIFTTVSGYLQPLYLSRQVKYIMQSIYIMYQTPLRTIDRGTVLMRIL